jgi:hypothetical protein
MKSGGTAVRLFLSRNSCTVNGALLGYFPVHFDYTSSVDAAAHLCKEVKVTLQQAMKFQRGSRGVAILFL